MQAGLVERARDGDELAFAALVDVAGGRCYAIAYRILRDVERAQDAVQQAFLLAWRELPKLRDPERFDVWLHRLLVNACYEEFRRYTDLVFFNEVARGGHFAMLEQPGLRVGDVRAAFRGLR